VFVAGGIEEGNGFVDEEVCVFVVGGIEEGNGFVDVEVCGGGKEKEVALVVLKGAEEEGRRELDNCV
jgi:hypothetical protein